MIPIKRMSTFRRFYNNWSSPDTITSRLSKQFVSEFKDFYSGLVDSTIAKTKCIQSAKLKSHIKKLSEYFPLTKFPLQGESLIYAYELLEKPENITEKMKHQAFTLACFMETCQAYFIIADDICDGGRTRNQKLCWHLLPDIGISAVNDLSMLRSLTNEYLRLNIDKNIYMQVMDVINEQYFRLEIGQQMDMNVAKSKNFDDFTMEFYDQKEYQKSSYYGLITPIRLALILSNNANEESFQLVEDICSDVAMMVQIHNDFTEYLELTDSLNTKKSCTDIQERKCSWLAVKALELCNSEQRKIFEENYGSYNPDKVKEIKNIYLDLDLGKLYIKEAQFRYDGYLQKVRKLSQDSVPSQDFFIKILELFRNYSDNVSRYYYD